jgi:putative sterol carrier protein
MAQKGKEPGHAGDATARFFEDLDSRDYEPLLHDGSGSLRVDLSDGGEVEHFTVRIDKGKVRVSRSAGRADATVRTERAMFNKMANGTVNAMSALLRGTLVIEGDLGIATAFSRLFPSPPDSERSFLERQR